MIPTLLMLLRHNGGDPLGIGVVVAAIMIGILVVVGVALVVVGYALYRYTR